MSPDSPKVRDFTAQDRSVPVVVEASPVSELLLSLFVWGNRADSDEYECGSAFFEQLEDGASDALTQQLTSLADCGELWLPLTGIAYEVGALKSVEAFISHVGSMDPMELRRQLIRGACVHSKLTTDEVAAATAGDPEAIAKLAEQEHLGATFLHLVTADPTESQRLIIDTLTGVYKVLQPAIAEVLPALERDADEKRSLRRTMDPPTLVETATNGVTFEMQPQISSVLLIPSKIIRPWTVIVEHGGMKIFAYSVADEHLLADPDAPPSYLVDLYKALGDERRLRMLAMLSEGDAGLMEIAQRVDLAKSTAHHHLRILRSAGLVRVTVGATKSYSLRPNQIPEAARLLDAYLTTPDEAAANAPAPQSERN